MLNNPEWKKIVEGWIHDLAASLKIPLKLDDEGICSLSTGDGIIITCEISKEYPQVHLYSPLIPFPEDDLETSFFLMARALELNAFQALTRGGSIGTLPGGGVLIFSYNIPIEGVDAVDFAKRLVAFYHTVIELKELLSEESVTSHEQKGLSGGIKG